MGSKAIQKIRIGYGNLHNELLPILFGQVFHFTTVASFNKILDCGAIKPNKDGKLGYTFSQSHNSYFRKKGCICIFDLRDVTHDILKKSIIKYSFLQPKSDINEYIYLFLDESCFGKLISWKKWKDESAHKDIIMPYIEAGFPGEIKIELIKKILHVVVDPPPDDSLVALLTRAHKKSYDSPDNKG